MRLSLTPPTRARPLHHITHVVSSKASDAPSSDSEKGGHIFSDSDQDEGASNEPRVAQRRAELKAGVCTVHFSAQPKLFLTLKTSPTRLNTPSGPTLNTP
jgi:hypothetical protein